MIYYLAKRLTGRPLAGFVASIFYALIYISLLWHAAQRDVYDFLLLLFAVIMAAREPRIVIGRERFYAGSLSGWPF